VCDRASPDAEVGDVKDEQDEIQEIVAEFLVESFESLDRLDQDLLALERDPDSGDALGSAFRTMHTIKGTSGFLGFQRIEKLAHAAESLLAALRDGSVTFGEGIAGELLATGDAMRRMLSSVEVAGTDGDDPFDQLIGRLGRLHGRARGKARAKTTKAVASGHEDPAEGDGPESVSSKVTDASVRVDVTLLDDLMTLVGELVLANNRITQIVVDDRHAGLGSAAQQLRLITTELQEGVMKTRMQPISTAWNKLPRVVRDLAHALGKQVRLRQQGEGTELDRSIIEAIRDPLTHLIRNAVDHGIESPAERRAAGKREEGIVQLSAYHKAGQVNIEIADDGRGIDVEALKAVALERGVIPASRAKRISDREALELIFMPGFSTAGMVTNLSGRGVGMDVARTNVERIGGTIDVFSRPGEGTTFKIKLPLTLAIIPALVIVNGGERYAIPQVNLLELVRPRWDEVESVHGAPVYRLRGGLLPLVDLERVLGREPRAQEGDEVTIVVLQADERRFGLIVEGVHETAEIVVKPLGARLKGLDTFAGATILGDGQVALILDVIGLAQGANVVDEDHDRARIEQVEEGEVREAPAAAMLLFEDHLGGRMAIPLAAVDRLEEFPRSAVEHVGAEDVVQYGAEILPLVDIQELLRERRKRRRSAPDLSEGETLSVLVYRHDDARVGLVVGGVLDIVADELDLKPASRAGVLGTAVIQQRVTEVLDVPALLEARERAISVGVSA
jgi:two-component system chemotaxis sensor kinase CheA